MEELPIKRKTNSIFKILNNQDGIALMMVITAITLLSAIMITFSFDSNVNKLKAYHIEDKSQARLTAEAGLQFAMVRLKLYKEAFNYVEKNDSVKDFATPEVLNSIWNFPFIYPIPVTDKMNQVQKDAISKFADNNLLQGSMKLIITNISNKININMLRVALMDEATAASQNANGSGASGVDEEYAIDGQIVKSLKYSIETKSEKDDYFSSLYMGIDPVELVNILKVNISDPESLDDDGGAAGEFDQIEISPKQSPFTIWSELYSMPKWDDDLVEIIQNEFTVHGAIMIDLNKMTAKLLRLIIPNITDDEVKEFFEYRDDPDAPKFFNTLEDFKNYIVNIGTIMRSSDFDERIKKFEANGLKFGPSPSLFKVIAVGQKGRAVYTLTCYIVLPAKPYKKPLRVATDEDKNANGIPDENEVPPTPEDIDGDGIPNDDDPEDNRTGADAEPQKQKTQLLNPRILEIFIS